MKITYKDILAVHRWSAFVLAVYVAMYALTGIVLIFPDVVPDRFSTVETVTELVEVAELPGAAEAASMTDASLREVGATLAGRLGLRGRLDSVTDFEGAKRFSFSRPGTVEMVDWTPGSPSVQLRVHSGSLRATLNRLHHLDGYRGDPRFWLWAAVVDIVSLSMLVFAGTGIYLWYVRKQKDRRLGWVILVGSTVFVVGSVAFLLFGK